MDGAADRTHRRAAAARRRVRTRRAERRGATLVIVAITMSVLLMFAAVGVDFGRLTVVVSRHESLADAVALASLVDRRANLSWNDLVVNANAIYAANLFGDVGGREMLLEAGQWDFGTKTFVRSSWAGTTASRVTGSITFNWSLARIFGVSTRTTRVEAIASLAAVRSSECLKPFLMPYGALLARLGRSSQLMTHQLTPSDLVRLQSAASEMPYTLQAASPFSTSGFVAGAFRTPTNSESDLAAALRPGCGTPRTISVNDSVYAYTGGVTSNTVLEALGQLCPGSGDVWARTCAPAPTVEVPIFDQAVSVGGQMRYRVKYIGAFRLTRISRESAGDRIYGYFTALNKSGAGDVLPMLGPVYRSALIK